MYLIRILVITKYFIYYTRGGRWGLSSTDRLPKLLLSTDKEGKQVMSTDRQDFSFY